MPRSLSTPVARALRLPRWSAADARLVLDALGSSGLRVPEFSRQHGVDPQRLYVWRRRLDARAAAANEAPLTFVQLQPTPPPPAHDARYEIVLAGGDVLRIEGSVVANDVVALLDALRGARPC